MLEAAVASAVYVNVIETSMKQRHCFAVVQHRLLDDEFGLPFNTIPACDERTDRRTDKAYNNFALVIAVCADRQ